MITREEAQKKLARKIHEETYKIEVQVLEGGFLPLKKNPKDAGFDLIATSDIILYPGQVIKHPLNIRMKLPTGSWGRIETKSGLGAKGQLVYAGVIDEEYRGVPHVIMTNLQLTFGAADETGLFLKANVEPIVIKKGEKVAQLTMNPHSTEFYIVQVDEVDTNTSRGEGGFGSTGV
jgi:dUTP pyrophosphatase